MFFRTISTDDFVELVGELQNVEHHTAGGPLTITGKHEELGSVVLTLDGLTDGAALVSQHDGVRFI